MNTEAKNPIPVELMVITAHPDDAEFGAAGTVAQWPRQGKIGILKASAGPHKR